MRKIPDSIQDLIRKPIEALGYELVGAEMVSKGRSGTTLRVYIDNTKGITLEDCSAISHQLSGVLDVANPIAGHYDLEVSSPGLDRPLFELAHFERFKGQKARITLRVLLQERRKLHGVLAGISGDDVLVKEEDVTYRVPFGQIETARLVPEF